MALPNIHPLNEETIPAYTTSMSGTTAYCVAPFRGIITQATMTPAALALASSGSSFCLINSVSTIGLVILGVSGTAVSTYVGTPTNAAAAYVNENDVIAFAPGAGLSAAPGLFSVNIRRA